MGSNYEKSMFRDLQAMMLKVDNLSSDVKELKQENKTLKQNHRTEMNAMKSQFEKKLKIQKQEFEKELLERDEKIEVLEAENKRLKGIINKDSTNSSKPPSSNGFKVIPNSREKSNRKIGGQKGHKGQTLTLIENPTEIVENKIDCDCGGTVRYSDTYKAEQVIDIEINVNVKEYRSFAGVCLSCQKKVQSPIPEGLNSAVTYGDKIKTLASILINDGMVSISRVAQIIEELTGGKAKPSQGSIVNFEKELSSKLSPFIEQVKNQLLISPVNHKDETGVKINGELNWLHVLSNKKYTLYDVNPKRGKDADKEMGVLPIYSGILVHDHWVSLYEFLCQHAECNAHILRYLKGVHENEGYDWAESMIKLLVDANNRIKELEANGVRALPKLEIHKIQSRYDEILDSGRIESKKCEGVPTKYQGEVLKLLNRMSKFKEQHLMFLTDFRVPFDNNQAERDLRMIKSKTKISGGFRSVSGTEGFTRIRSLISTLRKNSKNIFNGIEAIFSNNECPANLLV